MMKGIEPIRDGKVLRNNDFTTCELLACTSQNQSWQARAICAQFLSTRREKGVLQELQRILREDRSIEVIKKAADSFAKLGNQTVRDVFGSPFLELGSDYLARAETSFAPAPACDAFERWPQTLPVFTMGLLPQ
jgi:hypothetical protein